MKRAKRSTYDELMAAEAIGLGPCRTCGVGPGEPCRWSFAHGNGVRSPHLGRRDGYDQRLRPTRSARIRQERHAHSRSTMSPSTLPESNGHVTESALVVFNPRKRYWRDHAIAVLEDHGFVRKDIPAAIGEYSVAGNRVIWLETEVTEIAISNGQ